MYHLGASAYMVTVYESDSDVVVKEVGTPTNSIVIDSLTSGDNYDVSLQAVGPRGHLSVTSSPQVSFQTLISFPREFRTVQVDVDSVTVEWAAVFG